MDLPNLQATKLFQETYLYTNNQELDLAQITETFSSLSTNLPRQTIIIFSKLNNNKNQDEYIKLGEVFAGVVDFLIITDNNIKALLELGVKNSAKPEPAQIWHQQKMEWIIDAIKDSLDDNTYILNLTLNSDLNQHILKFA